jgi:cobalt-zinc-cadmium resistance protein CzcA
MVGHEDGTSPSPGLPAGVSIEVIYDRSFLIGRTLHTVLHNLAVGGLLVLAGVALVQRDVLAKGAGRA